MHYNFKKKMILAFIVKFNDLIITICLNLERGCESETAKKIPDRLKLIR